MCHTDVMLKIWRQIHENQKHARFESNGGSEFYRDVNGNVYGMLNISPWRYSGPMVIVQSTLYFSKYLDFNIEINFSVFCHPGRNRVSTRITDLAKGTALNHLVRGPNFQSYYSTKFS